MKKLLKAIGVLLFISAALVGVLILKGDAIEKWAYETFGKEEVRAFMKRFEPYIVLKDDDEENVEVASEEVEEEIVDIETVDLDENVENLEEDKLD